MDLVRINDKRLGNPVETIAYVTPQARNTATFLAFACDKIVMHPDARLGEFERYIQNQPSMEGAIGTMYLAGVKCRARNATRRCWPAACSTATHARSSGSSAPAAWTTPRVP